MNILNGIWTKYVFGSTHRIQLDQIFNMINLMGTLNLFSL
jgi:hypothetical protein